MKIQEIDYGISGIYHIIFDDGGRKPLVYIGCAICLKSRWNAHKSSLIRGEHENSVIQNKYDAYGTDSFEIKVHELYKGDRNKLKSREIYWIEKLKTFKNSKKYNGYGMNLTKGGDGFGTGSDNHMSRPCVVRGVRYECISHASSELGLLSQTVGKWIRSTSFRNKDCYYLDEFGNKIEKDCIKSRYDKCEDDKYISEERGRLKVVIPINGSRKSIGNFEKNELYLSRMYRDFWIKSLKSGVKFGKNGLCSKIIFFNSNIDLIPTRDLTKGFTFNKNKNKYSPITQINKKSYNLGRYNTPQEASKMYYFTLYNYALNGILPLKGKAQYKLYLDTKEKGSEHPIINHLFES